MSRSLRLQYSEYCEYVSTIGMHAIQAKDPGTQYRTCGTQIGLKFVQTICTCTARQQSVLATLSAKVQLMRLLRSHMRCIGNTVVPNVDACATSVQPAQVCTCSCIAAQVSSTSCVWRSRRHPSTSSSFCESDDGNVIAEAATGKFEANLLFRMQLDADG